MTASLSPAKPLSDLARPVTTLLGVGPERAALLSRLEIRTVEDLLLHRPNRHEDRQQLVRIAELELREPAITRGKVVALGTKWFKRRSKSIFELILDDGSGRLHCRWWNLPYMEKYFKLHDEILVFGKPINLKPRTIDHPETECLDAGEDASIHLNRITPIYPLTEGLGQRWLRALVWRTLQSLTEIEDPWPAALQNSGADLPSRATAIHLIHFPESLNQVEPARQRLALDEFVELQKLLRARRKNFEAKAQSMECGGTNRLIKPFLKSLRFQLTNGQTKVLREIRKDLAGRHPMRRLLQGDVGSGKTLVAACSALMTLESGYGVALMAPTEILAEQHFATFSKWFSALGIRVALRTGASKTDTAAQITIGTHALLSSGFAPERLGLVIIDEQHKFGVAQREELVRKGEYPHLLVMTATPIPRTLGLTLYGDLDVSVIDDLPPCRGGIRTFLRSKEQLPKVWDFVRSKLEEGKQAYVVYPHIEQSNQSAVQTLKGEFEAVQRMIEPFKVGILHGQLSAAEKQSVMSEFRNARIQVLLATSIIEVGVDVENATLMVIQNAEQFGLSQLHQLRGRIGRGSKLSHCVIVSNARNDTAIKRLRALEETSDGFRIAEADLKLRGPGELLGQQQSGMPRFRFGDLSLDLQLIEQARGIAAALTEVDGLSHC